MENIKFEITEQDIEEYLKKHKEDETIKYREAMFVRYMREHQKPTQEALEILMKKYNLRDNRIDGVYFYDDSDRVRSIPLKTFDSYLDDITNLDISGICHILIPTLGYYKKIEGYKQIQAPYYGLNYISKELLNTVPEDIDKQLKLALEDYCAVNKVDYRINYISKYSYKLLYSIKMGREHCRHELEEYSYIYGEDKVKQIRKIIRERF